MDSWLNWFRAAAVTVGTGITYLLGGWDTVLVALVVLIVLDYVTGLGAAWVEKRLDSHVGFRGIVKKCGMLVLVVVAGVIDRAAVLDPPVLRTITVVFLLANEGLSILENLAIIGVPIPGFLLDALQRLRDSKSEGRSQP